MSAQRGLVSLGALRRGLALALAWAVVGGAQALSLTLDPDSDDIMQLVNQGRHVEALAKADALVRRAESRTGRSSAETASALAFVGQLQAKAGQFAEAVTATVEAYEIFKATGAGPNVLAELAHSIGLSTRRAYDYPSSERWLLIAIRLAEQAQGARSAAVANYLEALGDTYRWQDRYGDALRVYRQAVAITGPQAQGLAGKVHARTLPKLRDLEQPGQRPDEIAGLVAELQSAERRFGRLDLETANAAWALANAYEDAGRCPEAIVQFERVLDVRTSLLDRLHPAVSSALAGIGRCVVQSGKPDIGIQMLRSAMRQREAFFGIRHPQVAPFAGYLASALEQHGQVEEAVALRLRAFILVYEGYAEVTLGRSHRPLQVAIGAASLANTLLLRAGPGDVDEAIYFLTVSVQQRERLRSHAMGLSDVMRQDVTLSHAWAYEKLAGLLIQRGRVADAERVLLMLKEAELRDFLARRGGLAGGAPTTSSLEDQMLKGALGRTAADWAALEAAWQEAQAGLRQGTLRSDGPEIAELDARRQRLESNGHRILREMALRHASGGTAAPPALEAAVARARTDLSQRLQAIQELPGASAARTVGVTMLPAGASLHLIVTTSLGAVPLLVEVDEQTLGKLVVEFRNAIRTRGDHRAAGQRLYEYLIAPVERQLGSSATVGQLAVMPHGVLKDLPFAALVDASGRHLVERYGVVTVTADGDGGLAGLELDPRATWRPAGMGASSAGAQFSNVALPGVRRELCDLVFDPAAPADCGSADRGLMPGKRYLDAAFTASALNRLMGPALDSAAPNVLHIATHFDVERSLLMLGDGDTLSIGEIDRWRPRLARYELVTLSACDTGRTAGNGESMGALFRKHGARAVLATLWPVADIGSAPFMIEFYRHRGAQRQRSKAEALRSAQLAMIGRGQASHGGTVVDLSHPHFWAGYVLMGNWL